MQDKAAPDYIVYPSEVERNQQYFSLASSVQAVVATAQRVCTLVLHKC